MAQLLEELGHEVVVSDPRRAKAVIQTKNEEQDGQVGCAARGAARPHGVGHGRSPQDEGGSPAADPAPSAARVGRDGAGGSEPGATAGPWYASGPSVGRAVGAAGADAGRPARPRALAAFRPRSQ